jgi:DNA end-binding protein Ku
MAARAIWKGIIKIGSTTLPVKLFSAVTDRTIHFRLLHRTDHQPVKQQLVSSESEETIEYEEAKKAFQIGRDRFVVVEDEELEELLPKASRDIEVSRFVDRKAIDPRWYERAYWLAPDGNTPAYFSLAEALEKKEKEGIARWVMRGKDYLGALRADDGYLMLIVLRYADEIIASSAIEAPEGRALEKKELAMGEQLLTMLEGKFDPAEYRDEYRERVLELVEAKAKGKRPKVEKFRPKKPTEDALESALKASLAGGGRKKVAGGRR